jgi:hypothetical protein
MGTAKKVFGTIAGIFLILLAIFIWFAGMFTPFLSTAQAVFFTLAFIILVTGCVVLWLAYRKGAGGTVTKVFDF